MEVCAYSCKQATGNQQEQQEIQEAFQACNFLKTLRRVAFAK